MYFGQFVNFCAVFQTHLCLGVCPEYHTFFDATALHVGIQSEAVLQPVLPHWLPHLKKKKKKKR